MSAREGREWVIDFDDYDSEEEARSAVCDELARLENMGHRLGRAFVVTPMRVPLDVHGTTIYETRGWVFSEQFMPAAKRTEPEPAPATVEEPVEA